RRPGRSSTRRQPYALTSLIIMGTTHRNCQPFCCFFRWSGPCRLRHCGRRQQKHAPAGFGLKILLGQCDVAITLIGNEPASRRQKGCKQTPRPEDNASYKGGAELTRILKA